MGNIYLAALVVAESLEEAPAVNPVNALTGDSAETKAIYCAVKFLRKKKDSVAGAGLPTCDCSLLIHES